MPAFNFQPDFVPLIESGQKCQTIRKSARGRPGDTAYLYTGQRTKQCRLIGTAPLLEVWPVEITAEGISVERDDGRDEPLEDAEDFARADGFETLAKMLAFFKAHYSLPFRGFVHRWGELKGEEE